MSETAVRLLLPDECALLLVDPQSGLAFGVGSIDRQMFLNNVIALAKTARAFGLPDIGNEGLQRSADACDSGRLTGSRFS